MSVIAIHNSAGAFFLCNSWKWIHEWHRNWSQGWGGGVGRWKTISCFVYWEFTSRTLHKLTWRRACSFSGEACFTFTRHVLPFSVSSQYINGWCAGGDRAESAPALSSTNVIEWCSLQKEQADSPQTTDWMLDFLVQAARTPSPPSPPNTSDSIICSLQTMSETLSSCLHVSKKPVANGQRFFEEAIHNNKIPSRWF